MDIDERINQAKELIAKREEIDGQLAEVFSGTAPIPKQRTCSRCGNLGHSVRTCTAPEKSETLV
jgi:hypothetical protein